MERGEKPFRSPPANGTLNSGYNFALHLDAQKTLWVGEYWGEGLHKFKMDDLWAGKATEEKVPGVTNWVAVIYQDSHGAVWTSAGNEFQPISRLQGNQVQYFSMETTGGGLPSDRVMCFQEGRDGLLYVATQAGMARYNGTSFAVVEGTSDRPLPRGRVHHIFRHRENVLWFASDSGLFRYDGVTWSSLDDEDGLAGLEVRTVAQDHEGAYWIGTNKWVTRYRPGRQAPAPPQLVVKTDQEHSSAEKIPAITPGQLVGFRFNAVDFKTRAVLSIVTPWYANAFIMVPGGGMAVGLVGWAFVARSLVIRRKREAEQLREQMFQQERQARAEMEAKNAQLETAKATKRLKGNPALKHIAVIAVTASSFREEEARARKACDGFIRKPFNRAELIVELKRFLKPVATPESQAVSEASAAPGAETPSPVSAAVLARRPGLMAMLREQEQTVWPRLCKTLAMGEMEGFAQGLRRWAEEGHWPSLRSYAEALEQQVPEFDFSRLPQTLQRFPEVIVSLP